MAGIFDDLLGTLRNSFQIGNAVASLKSFVVKRGAFLYTLTFNHTAARTADFPDDSGQVALVNAATQTFAAAVPFNKISTTFTAQTVTAVIPFTIAAGTKIPGATAIYRLIADGVNVPTFTGFREKDNNSIYNNGVGIVNLIEFTYDGVDAWYEIFQEKGVLPTWNSIAINFPTRAGNTITNVGQVYTPALTAGAFDSFMTSAQAIPQNKAGRITVKVPQATMVALCDTAIAESFSSNNFEYFAWNAGTIFTGSGAVLLNSGVTVPEPCWLRLTRANTGVVTVESSPSGLAGTWTLCRTFATTSLVPLWVTCNLTGTLQRTLEVISFEVEP